MSDTDSPFCSRYQSGSGLFSQSGSCWACSLNTPLKLNLRSDRGVCGCQSSLLASHGVLTPCLRSSACPVPLPTTRPFPRTSSFSIDLSTQKAHFSSFAVVTPVLLDLSVPRTCMPWSTICLIYTKFLVIVDTCKTFLIIPLPSNWHFSCFWCVRGVIANFDKPWLLRLL